MVLVEYGVVRVQYEKNQTRRHPRDKTHPRVAAPHIPRGVAEWNMSCCHEWMSFVEWMEPSLILFIYHVELSSASGISELYHDAKCSNQSRNSNFVPQKIVNFNPDGEKESDVKVFRHNVKVLGHNVKVIGL